MRKALANSTFGKIIHEIIKEESVYYNFPVSLLGELLDYTSETFQKILAWATYDYIKNHEKEGEHGYNTFQGETGWKSIKPAVKALQYSHNGNMVQWYKYCGEIYKNYKGARTGLSQSQYWELRECFSSMLDEEKGVWLAFLSFKSILGNKSKCQTNDLMLFARMNGHNSTFAGETDLLAHSHPVIANFYTRRKRETLRRILADKFHIAIYSNHDRGYHISTKLSLNKLAEVVEANRKSTIKTHKKKLADARALALAKLAQKPP